MAMNSPKPHRKLIPFPVKQGEKSFTLIETLIALGMLVVMILETGSVQGNAIYFVEFERNLSKATWLAKGVMERVEYEWNTRSFSELEVKSSRKEKFTGYGDEIGEFTYNYRVEESKVDLISLLTKGSGGEASEEASADGLPGGTDMIRQALEAVLGDEVLKLAKVEVFWPEGAVENSVELTLWLPNLRKVSEVIAALPSAIKKKKKSKKTTKKKEKATSGTTPPATTGGGDE